VYVAKSVRPFAITRSGTGSAATFTLSPLLRGTLGHSGEMIHGSPGCTVRYQETATVSTVQGYLVLNGRSPAPLVAHVSWVGGSGDPVKVSWKREGSRCPTTSTVPSTYGNSSLVFPPARLTLPRFDLSRRFGKAFTLEHRQELDGRSPGTHLCSGQAGLPGTRSCRITYRWTFAFTPVGKVEPQRWQVEVRGSDRWSWGRTATLGAGVWVDWVHRTEVVLEDGKVTRATGRVAVEKATPFSDPDGVFTVSFRTTTYPPYTPRKAVKRVGLLELGLWRDPGSTYRVDFTVGIAGPQALALMRTWGVPSPDTTYQELVKRGRVASVVIPLVPATPRLVVELSPSARDQARQTDAFAEQLACTKGASVRECFRQRGGELVTVHRLG
jgi:hypothetical protein